MAYKLTELSQARDYFHSIFGLGLGSLLEHTITMVWIGKLSIDIVKFDNAIQKKHPNENGLSLSEIIHKYYGDEGMALLDELLP